MRSLNVLLVGRALRELASAIGADMLPLGLIRSDILEHVPQGHLYDRIAAALIDDAHCIAHLQVGKLTSAQVKHPDMCCQRIQGKLSAKALKSVGTFLNGILGLVVAEQVSHCITLLETCPSLTWCMCYRT